MGKLEETEADPIIFELYRIWCKYEIETGDIFVWAYTVLKWSCMARPIFIDDLAFSVI